MPTEQEVRQVLRRLRREGWELESGKGSTWSRAREAEW